MEGARNEKFYSEERAKLYRRCLLRPLLIIQNTYLHFADYIAADVKYPETENKSSVSIETFSFTSPLLNFVSTRNSSSRHQTTSNNSFEKGLKMRTSRTSLSHANHSVNRKLGTSSSFSFRLPSKKRFPFKLRFPDIFPVCNSCVHA